MMTQKNNVEAGYLRQRCARQKMTVPYLIIDTQGEIVYTPAKKWDYLSRSRQGSSRQVK